MSGAFLTDTCDAHCRMSVTHTQRRHLAVSTLICLVISLRSIAPAMLDQSISPQCTRGSRYFLPATKYVCRDQGPSNLGPRVFVLPIHKLQASDFPPANEHVGQPSSQVLSD